MQQIFPLVGAWMVSLFVPVFIMACGIFVGLLIDKALLHLKDPGPASFIALVVPGALIGGFYAGWIQVTLNVARRERVTVADMFQPIHQVITAAIVLCSTVFLMGITSWLFIVAPIIFLKFQLAPYFVVDQDYGPLASMKKSWTETNRIFVPLAVMDLLFAAASTAFSVTMVVPFACFILQGVASAVVYQRWVVDNELEEISMKNVHEIDDDDDDDEED